MKAQSRYDIAFRGILVFVQGLIATNVNKSIELNFSDIYRSVTTMRRWQKIYEEVYTLCTRRNIVHTSINLRKMIYQTNMYMMWIGNLVIAWSFIQHNINRHMVQNHNHVSWKSIKFFSKQKRTDMTLQLPLCGIMSSLYLLEAYIK